jgi:hypothetical protein
VQNCIGEGTEIEVNEADPQATVWELMMQCQCHNGDFGGIPLMEQARPKAAKHCLSHLGASATNQDDAHLATQQNDSCIFVLYTWRVREP